MTETSEIPTIAEITDELTALGWPPDAARLDDDSVVLFCSRAGDDTIRLVATGDTAHLAYLRALRQAREMVA